MYYKSYADSNFHILYSFKNVDFCALVKKSTPVYVKMYDVLHSLYPQYAHCPFKKGEIVAVNYTYSTDKCDPKAVKQKPNFNLINCVLCFPDGKIFQYL